MGDEISVPKMEAAFSLCTATENDNDMIIHTGIHYLHKSQVLVGSLLLVNAYCTIYSCNPGTSNVLCHTFLFAVSVAMFNKHIRL